MASTDSEGDLRSSVYESSWDDELNRSIDRMLERERTTQMTRLEKPILTSMNN